MGAAYVTVLYFGPLSNLSTEDTEPDISGVRLPCWYAEVIGHDNT